MSIEVVTYAISEDFGEADKSHGYLRRGIVSNEEIGNWFNQFVTLEFDENADNPPHLMVETGLGNFQVVRSGNKLLVTNIDDPNQANIEATPDTIINILTGEDRADTEEDILEANLEKVVADKARRERVLGIVSVVAYIVIAIFWTYYVSTHRQSPFPKLTYEEITDSDRIAELEGNYAGSTFFSGQQPGDILFYFSTGYTTKSFEFFESNTDSTTVLEFFEERPYQFVSTGNQTAILIDDVGLVTLLATDKAQFDGITLNRFPGDFSELTGK